MKCEDFLFQVILQSMISVFLRKTKQLCKALMNIRFNNIRTARKSLCSFGFSITYNITCITKSCIDYYGNRIIGDFTVYHQSRLPISVAGRSEAWVCDHSLPGLLGVPVPPGAWMSVSCGCCVLLGRGLSDRPITRPEDPTKFGVPDCDRGTSWRRISPLNTELSLICQ